VKNKTFKSTLYYKYINIAIFLFGALLVEATFCLIFLKIFLPAYFFLDVIILLILSLPVLFFKATKFDTIYLSIIIFLYSVGYTLNAIYFASTGNLFDIRNATNFTSIFSKTPSGSITVRIGYFFLFLGLGLLIIAAIIYVNVFRKPKFKRFDYDKENNFRKTRIKISLFSLIASISLYSLSFGVSYINEKSTNFYIRKVHINSVNNVKKFGLPSYYVKEFLEFVFPSSLSANEIKTYFTDSQYLNDTMSGKLSNSNVITITIETGQNYLLNNHTMKITSKYINDGLKLSNCYSKNKTNVSEMIGIIGNSPSTVISARGKYSTPFSLPSILAKKGYQTSYYADLSEDDVFHDKLLMPQLGFEHCYFEDHLLKNKPANEPNTDYQAFKQITDDIQQMAKPFYVHYTSYYMHGEWHKNSHKNLYDFLNSKYGNELDNYERNGQWNNKLKGKPGQDEFRNYTLASMDFDAGFKYLIDGLNNKGILDNTLIVLYGDHDAWYTNSSGAPMSWDVHQTDNWNEVKNYDVICGMYHKDLQSFYGSNVFDKFTSPMIVVPTILDLLGIKYNPKFYQGKSIFDPSYNEEVFYCSQRQSFFNTNYMSLSGQQIDRVFNDNNTKKIFMERVEYMKKQLFYIDELYQTVFFKDKNINDYMPRS